MLAIMQNAGQEEQISYRRGCPMQRAESRCMLASYANLDRAVEGFRLVEENNEDWRINNPNMPAGTTDTLALYGTQPRECRPFPDFDPALNGKQVADREWWGPAILMERHLLERCHRRTTNNMYGGILILQSFLLNATMFPHPYFPAIHFLELRV